MLRILGLDAGTILSGGLALALSAPLGARAGDVFYTFTGASGSQPVAGLIKDSAGNFYGTTSVGGANNVGAVFKIAPNGAETILHSFAAGGDGESPWSTLVRDSAGDLYGTTTTGGAYQKGAIFEVAANGAESVLYSFTAGSDGGYPASGLVMDGKGNLYGTTVYGGAVGGYYGTVYKLAPGGRYAVLHSFTGAPDGEDAVSGLLRDRHGNLYGATYEGGANGAGTVYKVAPNGAETVLYSFCSQTDCSDGGGPNGRLIADKLGNLYGTTSGGGSSNGYGTVFELSPARVYTVLHTFCSQAQNCTDGTHPYGGVALDSSGNLYGTTTKSYTGDNGTVFEVTPAGAETVLYRFTGGSDGSEPYANPLLDGSHLYGTTVFGGADNAGIVFKIAK